MVDRAVCMLLPVLLILLRCVMSNERLELLNLFCYFCFSPGDRRGFKPGVHWNLMSLGETLDPELFPGKSSGQCYPGGTIPVLSSWVRANSRFVLTDTWPCWVAPTMIDQFAGPRHLTVRPETHGLVG